MNHVLKITGKKCKYLLQGATFFSESGAMEDREYLQPILASYGIFKPMKTVHLFNLHLLATLVIEVSAVVYTILHPNQKNECREYFYIIYGHVALWFLTLVSLLRYLCL